MANRSRASGDATSQGVVSGHVVGHFGCASIPITKRNTADLNWLMMRYPLRIAHEKFYERHLQEARENINDPQSSMLGVCERPPTRAFEEHEKDMPNLRGFIKGAWENRNPDKTYMKILRAKGKI